LELDAHSADAGIDTRIEAFLDVIRGYRQTLPTPRRSLPFQLTRLEPQGGALMVAASDGSRRPLTDPSVRVLMPSMGDIGAEAMAAAFRYGGIQAVAAPPPGVEELELGKEIATCKECLPLLLTAGSLRRYLQQHHRPGEILLYFMPTADGPYRQGQYRVFLEKYLARERIADVGLLSLDCKNSYAGLSSRLTRRGWQGICISDGLEDIRAAILALATDPREALQVFEQSRHRILQSLANDSKAELFLLLRREMRQLGRLERKRPLAEATKISLLGEIYARRDGFSRQQLVERLAERDIVVRTAPVNEWLHYTDYFILQGLDPRVTLGEKLSVRMKQAIKRQDEATIRQALLLSGFYQPTEMPMHELISRGASLISPLLDTEAILTISAALLEIGDETQGVISIGPFGCLPGRISEAVLNYRLEAEKPQFSLQDEEFWRGAGKQLALPFLAIETDGNPFPQVVEARLESFILAAHRLREELATLRAAATERRRQGYQREESPSPLLWPAGEKS
ncbi:MAG: CoA activase, partial [Desulfuromonadales bacterium]|nr:CoA activase [Desulfuromonadales bacterium]